MNETAETTFLELREDRNLMTATIGCKACDVRFADLSFVSARQAMEEYERWRHEHNEAADGRHGPAPR